MAKVSSSKKFIVLILGIFTYSFPGSEVNNRGTYNWYYPPKWWGRIYPAHFTTFQYRHQPLAFLDWSCTNNLTFSLQANFPDFHCQVSLCSQYWPLLSLTVSIKMLFSNAIKLPNSVYNNRELRWGYNQFSHYYVRQMRM